MILNGSLPKNIPLEEILKHLDITRGKNQVELFGFLSRKHFRDGNMLAEGLVSCRLVTAAFTRYLVDSLQDSSSYPMDAFKYHALGTGGTAEANSQTSLVTEVESRVAGTQVEGASPSVYKSVATVTFTGSHAIAEHGLFSAATSGTMMDRSALDPVDNVIADDQIEYTYQLTVTPET
jgi:hypothetical protein